MSMIRLPSKAHGLSSRSSFNHLPGKKRIRKKPGWDDTVSNLEVHKASTDEIVRRKDSHKSLNVDLVQADKLRRKISRAQKTNRTPVRRKPNALLQEVLQDQSQLQDTLVSSDKLMAVVKDLFGDDPRKFRGLPNVTVAPNQGSADKLPDGSKQSGPSKLDILSDSVMDRSALNDLDESSEVDTGEEDEDPQYQPVMDMARFQQLLEQAEKEEERQRKHGSMARPGQATRSLLTQSMAERALTKTLDMMPDVKDAKMNHQNGQLLQVTPEASPKLLAINDTAKISKTMARTTEEERSSLKTGSANNNVQCLPTPNLQHLEQILGGLHNNISDCGEMTDKRVTASTCPDPNTFSGFSVSLMESVAKLTSYVKENEFRYKAEATLREQQTQDMYLMKGLVDALTTDIISTQEEINQLRLDFSKYKQNTNLNIATLKQTLQSHGIEVPPVLPEARQAFLGQTSQSSSQVSSDPAAYRFTHVSDAPPAPLSILQQLTTASSTLGSTTGPSPGVVGQGMSAFSSVSSQQTLLQPVARQGSPTLSEIADQVSHSLQIQANAMGPPKSTVNPATLLSPPRQADSTQVTGTQKLPEEALQQVRQTLKFSGAPDNVQEIIKLQQQRRAGVYVPTQTMPLQSSQVGQGQQLTMNGRDHQPLLQGVQYVQTTQAAQNLQAEQNEIPPGRELLHQQLAELAKQHQQAEEKLKNLMTQQKPSQPTVATMQRNQVSPSISPIPVSPDNTLQHYETSIQSSQAGGLLRPRMCSDVQRGGRIITVALPRADMVDSPPQSYPSAQGAHISRQPPPRLPTAQRLSRPPAVNHGQDGWCTLSKIASHER